MKNDNTIDYNSSGYVAQLFSIFQNVKDFCVIESGNCLKGSSEDIVKYNIISYPKIIFVLFDMNYTDLYDNKNQIFKLIEENIILNVNVEYKLAGIIASPSFNHYNIIIFNPIGCNIDKKFCSNFIYYHDGTLNSGRITQLNPFENYKNIGIPYIIVFKYIEK